MKLKKEVELSSKQLNDAEFLSKSDPIPLKNIRPSMVEALDRHSTLEWLLIFRSGIKGSAKELLRKGLIRFVKLILKKPILKGLLIRVLHRLGLLNRVKLILISIKYLKQPSGMFLSYPNSPVKFEDLSPRGRQIYTELKKAINERQKNGEPECE